MKNRNKIIGNNCIWTFITVILLLCFGTMSFGVIPAGAASTCSVQILKDAREAAAMVSEDWEEDYYEKILIREDSNLVEVDGERETFTGTFGVNARVMKKAVSSEENLSAFLEKKEEEGRIYAMEKEEDGSYCVTSPYQSRRIVIFSTDVKDSYGAEEKYIYEEGNETILCFDTEEKTRDAYDKILAAYGEKNCFVDEICSVRDLAQSVSWGNTVTEMEALKTGNEVAALSSKVTVAVIDTGINRNHDLFQGRTILNTSYNFMGGNTNITDTNGHGTHVAGIIADATPENVQFLILKIADEDGSSSSLVMNLALNYAVSRKADIMNVSFGFLSEYASRYTFLDAAIDRAYEKGIPVVTAAGNLTDDVNGRSVSNSYPACNEQTVTVSALDRDLRLADYSFYGKCIDFSAPGTGISSAWIGSGEELRKESGTSMAAPHITAALSYIKLRNRNMSVQGTCLELSRYCTDLGTKGKDEKYGYGCPKMKAMFDSALTYASWTVAQMPRSPVLTTCRNGDGGTELVWEKIPGADSYRIYRRKNGGVNCRIATVTSNSYVDRKTTEGDYCVYYVTAFTKKNGTLSSSGKSNVAVNITLKKIKISKVKASGKKKVTIRRKRLECWDGKKIQVQYSRQKSFRKKYSRQFPAYPSSYTFTSKKKGNIYIRVRSIFQWEGKTYRSPWSKVKKVRVK